MLGEDADALARLIVRLHAEQAENAALAAARVDQALAPAVASGRAPLIGPWAGSTRARDRPCAIGG